MRNLANIYFLKVQKAAHLQLDHFEVAHNTGLNEKSKCYRNAIQTQEHI